MSNIREDIGQQIKEALRQGEKERLGVLRMIGSEISKLEIEKRQPINEAEFIALLNRMCKQHQASMDQFKQGGRDDLYKKEEAEKTIVESFLPEQLSPKELEQMINSAIENIGARSKQDIGKVMGQIKNKLLGKADMGEVSRIVKEKLGD